MTTIAANESIVKGPSGAGIVVGAILAVWFAAAVAAGANGVFLAGPDTPPFALMSAAAGPPILFLLAYGFSERVRGFALSLNLGLLTAFQAWRVLGAGMLFLYAYGHLPGLFAWPAGLGDVAVGLAAPFAVLALMRRSPGWQRRVFWLNIAGLADFAAAVGTGLLTSGTAIGIFAGAVNSDAMAILPMSLLPSFGVPLFIIMHAISLLQLRAQRREGVA
ncbi:MAG: hypothetical protein QNJ94_03925 [Alphaproteobacteria bacterium]|nr:hypothetical protein [Alphaproteobacteria bacterium]